MKDDRPRFDLDDIAFIICTGAVFIALTFVAGYWFGSDHARMDYEVKLATKRAPLPCNCLCGLTEQKLRTITWRHCRKVGA